MTGCVALSDEVAVAENCAVAPTKGADPATATETTLGADCVLTPTGEGAAVDGEPPAQASLIEKGTDD